MLLTSRGVVVEFPDVDRPHVGLSRSIPFGQNLSGSSISIAGEVCLASGVAFPMIPGVSNVLMPGFGAGAARFCHIFSPCSGESFVACSGRKTPFLLEMAKEEGGRGGDEALCVALVEVSFGRLALAFAVPSHPALGERTVAVSVGSARVFRKDIHSATFFKLPRRLKTLPVFLELFFDKLRVCPSLLHLDLEVFQQRLCLARIGAFRVDPPFIEGLNVRYLSIGNILQRAAQVVSQFPVAARI